MFTNDSRFALVPASVKEQITTALQAEADTYVLREVYEWLGYSTYQHARTAFDNCGFAETLDFTTVTSFRKIGFGEREVKDISMTSDCFKAFAMQARTERGKQVRLYFIECERQLKRIVQKPQSALECILVVTQELIATNKRVEAIEDKLERHLPAEDYYTLLAYVNLHPKLPKPTHYPSVGKALVQLSNSLGVPVKSTADAKYGSCNTYHTSVLEAYFSA